MNLPEEMLVGLEEFTRFHDATTNKTRKLTWQVGAARVGAARVPKVTAAAQAQAQHGQLSRGQL